MRGLRHIPTAIFCLGLMLCAFTHAVHADEEAAPYTHVTAGAEGRCYAKSIPKTTGAAISLQAGITRVFRVRDDNDMLVDEYRFYADELFVQCAGIGSGMDSIKIALVRRGPWHRGAEASSDQLALAFYVGGEERKAWSTADIAATAPDGVDAIALSRGHYRVFSAMPGFVWREDADTKGGGQWVFEAVTVDGRHLLFDPATGTLLP